MRLQQRNRLILVENSAKAKKQWQFNKITLRFSGYEPLSKTDILKSLKNLAPFNTTITKINKFKLVKIVGHRVIVTLKDAGPFIKWASQ